MSDTQLRLYQNRFPRTVHTLPDRLRLSLAGHAKALGWGQTSLLPVHRTPLRLECWVFEDLPKRRATEAVLRKMLPHLLQEVLGAPLRSGSEPLSVHVRSAYKPLLHFFLEEVLGEKNGACWGEQDTVHIEVPVIEGEPRHRFLLECYPLAELLAPGQVTFALQRPAPFIATPSSTLPAYRIHRRGYASQTVLLPLCQTLHADRRERLSATGWWRLAPMRGQGAIGEGALFDERLETDYERLFHQTMGALAAHDWGETAPFFETLRLKIGLPHLESTLPHGEERLSFGEILHEEFYFSLLAFFRQYQGKGAGDRAVQPGQIVPEIFPLAEDADVYTIEVTREAWEKPFPHRHAPRDASDAVRAHHGAEDPTNNLWKNQLRHAERPLSPDRVARILENIPGQRFTAHSVRGTTLQAVYRKGGDAPVMISGGQHANETSGVVGALRAGLMLDTRHSAHFTLAPLENPDGYTLHQKLIQTHPLHMHHAARYTALGDDLEARSQEPFYEKSIRIEAQRLSGAKLHINLHGYPSHEWVQPLSGYIPPGFDLWSLPKGFLLIVRYHPGYEKWARAFVEALSMALQKQQPALLAFTRQQLAIAEKYLSPSLVQTSDPASFRPWEVINGFPCILAESGCGIAPLTLITEYPDETLQGEAFVAAHDAQYAAALAAYDIHQALVSQFKG